MSSIPTHQDDPDYFIQINEKWVAFCIAFAAFTFQFEAFLVSVSLPDMARELDTSSTAISFVLITYLLGASIVFVPAGHLGYRYGLRTIFLFGCAFACIGTLASGLSSSLSMLCVSRFIQGTGMGAIVATSYAMVPAWVSKTRLGWGYGMLSLGAGLGMIAGLPVGGLIAYYLSWHWIFLATVPIFVLLIGVANKYLPRHRTSCAVDSQVDHRQDLDWLSIVIFSIFIITLILSISLGAELGWTSVFILSLAIINVLFAGLMIFRLVKHTLDHSDSLLRCQGFVAGLVVLFLFQFVSAGLRFLMPFHLEISFGFSVLVSSYLLLMFPLSFAPTGVWSGRLADRVGSWPIVTSSIGLCILICAIYAGWVEQKIVWMFCGFMIIFGIASALFSPANNRLIMLNVPQKFVAQASALLPVALNVGSMLGVSVFETLFSLYFPQDAMSSLGFLSQTESSEQILNEGFERSFVLASLVFCVTLTIMLKLRRSS